jgi:two-component system chemotaxis response regulator CheY
MSFKFEKMSILVVEDTIPMQKLVVSVLETLGVGTIYAAANGEKGFEIFCDKKPDIVLADWHMQPMSGVELIDKIRNDKLSPHKMVPVIMMTGYSALPRVSEARDAGATEFLVKPFSASDLAKRIAYVINKPRDFIDSRQYFGPDRRRRKIENYQGPKRRTEER